MSLLVVGSVALDSVKTPFGEVTDALGGSANYFSLAASFFTPVSMVAVVGDDFPGEHLNFMKSKGIDTKGVKVTRGKTFRWSGEYGFDLNDAKTLDTQLNVFEDFHPMLPESYRNAPYVFLANIDPDLQLEVLEQVENPKLIVADTMNYWISSKPESLRRLLSKLDILVINEAEVRQLAKEPNLRKAERIIRGYGPRILVIKRGEYGVLMFTESSIFSIPAYPLETVFDPTGAGDSFAGGFVGFLAYTKDASDKTLRQAAVMGSTMASFNVEDFSVERLKTLKHEEVEKRYQEFINLTQFNTLEDRLQDF